MFKENQYKQNVERRYFNKFFTITAFIYQGRATDLNEPIRETKKNSEKLLRNFQSFLINHEFHLILSSLTKAEPSLRVSSNGVLIIVK